MLWDFFTDSSASKEWRALTGFLQSCGGTGTTAAADAHPFPVDLQPRASKARSRHIIFDALQHKLLEYELKALYVAVTRARKRLFIFDRGSGSGDEADWPRTAAFEFLERQGLVELTEQKDASTFAVASTPQQWRDCKG